LATSTARRTSESRPRRPQQRRDDVVGRRRDRDDAQLALAGPDRLGDRPAALLERPDDVRGVPRERLAGGARPDPAADALAERGADLGRRGVKRRRHRRLPDDELVGRRPHRAGAHERQERP
jgi:hypothetical protein